MYNVNKFIKISSIIYIIISLLAISYAPVYGGIYLTIGIGLLSYSFLSLNELSQKKTILVIIAIISVFLNLPSAILLFIANDEITQYRKENNIQIQETQVSSETKRIDILLKIGLGMILVSGILLATSNWEVIPNSMKCISLIVMGILFLGLSRFSENKLKIEKTTKAYYILGLSFFVLTLIGVGIFGIISTWFSYTGDGKHLVYFLTFIELAIILLLIGKKFDQKEYSYLAVMCGYLSIYHILMLICLPSYFAILVISIIVLIINLVITNKKYIILTNISKVICYLYWPLIIVQQNSELNNTITIITAIINIGNLLYLTSKSEERFDNIISVIISYILIINLNLRMKFIYSEIILFVTTTIFYITINNIKFKSNPQNKNINQIIYNILTTITLLSMSNDMIELFICTIIYGLVNFVNCYIVNRKDSKFDLYYQPVIICLIVASINNLIYEIIEINELYILSTISIIYAFIHYLVKDIKLKKIYFISLIIMIIIALLSNAERGNIMVAGINIALSFYLYKSNSNSIWSYILFVLSILLLTSSMTSLLSSEVISNIIILIIIIILTYLYKNNDSLKKINLISITIPLYLLVNSIDIYDDIKTIFINVLCLYVIFLIATLFIKQKKDKDIFATITTSLSLLNIIFSESFIIGLYIGVISIIIILFTYNKKEYKSFFYCGVAITIINILIQLGEYWSKIPFWLYLLVVGISIIMFVTHKELNKQKQTEIIKESQSQMISKKSNSEQNIENSSKVSTNIVEKTTKYCTNCGTPNNGGRYCKQCGNFLVINSNH